MAFKLKTLNAEYVLPDSEKGMTNVIAQIFSNRGRVSSENIVLDSEDMKNLIMRPRDVVLADATTSTDILPLMEVALSEAIRMPIEPRMVLSGLFTKINQKGGITQIVTGIIGAVAAEDIDEGEDYPEVMIQRGDGSQVVTMGKSGIKMGFTEEALRYSTWDLVSMGLQLMRDALMRLKEQKAGRYMRNHGVVLYDNLSPSSSLFGTLTGRARDMTANGSMRMEDLFRGYAHMSEEGFPPDTLLMHPLHYLAGYRDPVMREMLIHHGQGAYIKAYSGSFGNNVPWDTLGGRAGSTGLPVTPGDNVAGSAAGPQHGRDFDIDVTAPIVSEVFPFPLRVMSSPYLPFDHTNMLGDMFLIKTGAVGLEMRDEEITLVEWDDKATDKTYIKLRERYSLNVIFDGMGIGVIRNVPALAQNYDGNLQYTVAGSTAEVVQSTPIAGL